MRISNLPRSFVGLALAALAATLPGTHTHAQQYPSKPITMVVPFPAGGASDFVGRLLGKELHRVLGQPVVVENSAGAGGSIGINKAMSHPADGYTLMLSSPLDVILAALNFNSATYRPEDLRPVLIAGKTELMLVTRKDLGVNTPAELIAKLKSSTAKPLSFCSVGLGSLYHLVAERLLALTNTRALHVPYTSFTQCITDLGGGQVDFTFLPIGGPFPGMVDNGTLKLVAVVGERANARFPNAALMSSLKGLEDFRFTVWAAVHVSGKTPEPVVQALHKAFATVMTSPEVRKSLVATGASLFDPPLSLQETQNFYNRDILLYTEMAKLVGVKKQ